MTLAVIHLVVEVFYYSSLNLLINDGRIREGIVHYRKLYLGTPCVQSILDSSNQRDAAL